MDAEVDKARTHRIKPHYAGCPIRRAIYRHARSTAIKVVRAVAGPDTKGFSL